MKMEDGSARYGARRRPKRCSVAAEVAPTRMGMRGGKEASLPNVLFEMCESGFQGIRECMRRLPFEHLVDVGQVHLKTVLVFVDGLGHLVKRFGRVQLGDGVFIQLQVAEESLVSVAFRERAAAEIEVVGGA